MNRRTYLSVAAVGLVGCLEQDQAEYSDGRDIRQTNTSNAPQSGDDPADDEEKLGEPDTPFDQDRSYVHGAPFDDFSDLSQWTALDGSLARPRNSKGGAVLEASRSDTRVWISRTLSERLDCSTTVPGLSISSADSVVPRIQLFDSEGNRADFRRAIGGHRYPVRYTFGLESVTGSLDLSDITQVRILLWVGDRSREIELDELFFVPRSPSGTVSIQFDDGYATDYTEAFPILDRYGYRATSFVNPTTIGSDGRLDISLCSRLRDAGWIIGSHRYSHRRLGDLSPDEQVEEIVDAHEWLVDHGFVDGAKYFAYPFGEWNERILDIVGKYHDLAFWSGKGLTGYPVNPALCPRVGEPDAKTAINLLNRAAQWGGHVTLFYHELRGDQHTDFERTIDHLHALESAGRIDVVMPSDLKNNVVE